MKKQIFTLLTLLVLCVTGAWATNEVVVIGANTGAFTIGENTHEVAGNSNGTNTGTIANASDGQTASAGSQMGGTSNIGSNLSNKNHIRFTVTAGELVRFYYYQTSGSNKSTTFATSNYSQNSTYYHAARAYNAAAKNTLYFVDFEFADAGTYAISVTTGQSIYAAALKFDARPAAPISWSASSFNAIFGESNSFPTLTNDNGLTVSYASSTDAVTINSSTGEITLKHPGTTTISATYTSPSNESTYRTTTKSYELTVNLAAVSDELIRFDVWEPESLSTTTVKNGKVELIATSSNAVVIRDVTTGNTIDGYTFGREINMGSGSATNKLIHILAAPNKKITAYGRSNSGSGTRNLIIANGSYNSNDKSSVAMTTNASAFKVSHLSGEGGDVYIYGNNTINIFGVKVAALKCGTPTFAPNGGSVEEGGDVTITSEDATSIKYAWTAAGVNTPDSWTTVTATDDAITIQAPALSAGTPRLHAYGIHDGWTDGDAAYKDFTIAAADNTAPTLTAQSIADGATGVAVAGNITLTFDENVQVANAAGVTLTGGAATISSVTASDNVVTIAYTGLANSTTYTLTVSGDAITDAAATPNAYAGTSFSFTTMAPKCADPTIAVGAFDWTNKKYVVTITNNEDGSTLNVSTDGVSYETQTSPYEVNVTSTTHFYAKAEKSGYDDSEIVEENVINDNTKPYIAWMYEHDLVNSSNYRTYDPSTDKMVQGLEAEGYNVIPVACVQGTDPTTLTLTGVSLIVCTEAMTGNKTFSNGIVNLLDGTTPMIGLKAFNYSTGRWAWGTPSNPGTTTLSFTPSNSNYKVLSGVTLEGGTIKVATAKGSSDNVIQTVNFDGASKPTDNVIMGTVEGNEEKAVMYYSASKKYFGLGISVDCMSKYTDNTVTIIKNAAKMLIAGEDLAATPAEPEDPTVVGETVTVPVSANMAGWRSFYDASQNYTVETDTKVYYASATNSSTNKVTLTEIAEGVPANTPVILYKDGATSITLTKTATSIAAPGAANKLAVSTAAQDLSAGVYRLGYKTSDGVGFYKYTNASAPAGIIYISALDSPANFLGFDFGDTTGIGDVRSKMSDVRGEFFNLAGQKVAQPTKGLYIVNGKKVVLK